MSADTDLSSIIDNATLLDRLERYAMRAIEQIAKMCDGSDAIACELQDKFLSAVSDLNEIRIVDLPAEDGAFATLNGVLKVNSQAVLKLLDYVLKDVQAKAATGMFLTPDEILEIQRQVVLVYILHEIRHRTQGVGKYQTVKELKVIAGFSVMSEFDVFADRDAAFAFAALNSNYGDRDEFLNCFETAFFFSQAYFFNVFAIDNNRTDKIARAISIFLMLARISLAKIDRKFNELKHFPLDAVIYAKLSTTHKELAIFHGEPSQKLLAVANDIHDIGSLVEDVKQGNFDTAFRRSVRLVRQLKI